jgi:hypothetical protein
MHEFVLHSKNHEWIGDFHRDAQAAVTTHKVQLIAQTDPEWAVYEQLLPAP